MYCAIACHRSGSTVMQMTHEQLRICSHNVKDGDTVKIIAFAGECGHRENMFILVIDNYEFQHYLLATHGLHMLSCSRGTLPLNVLGVSRH